MQLNLYWFQVIYIRFRIRLFVNVLRLVGDQTTLSGSSSRTRALGCCSASCAALSKDVRLALATGTH